MWISEKEFEELEPADPTAILRTRTLSENVSRSNHYSVSTRKTSHYYPYIKNNKRPIRILDVVLSLSDWEDFVRQPYFPKLIHFLECSER